MNTSSPLPEFIRIRDIAKRWEVDIPYVLQFQNQVKFLFGPLPEYLRPYDPDEILREVEAEAKGKGENTLMAKLKFAENEIPKLEASMLWLHRDDVLKIENTNTINGNPTQTGQQGNQDSRAEHIEESARPLTRVAIKKIFSELDAEQWRGLFGREKDNGLGDARIGEKGRPLYDVCKLRNWLVNVKGYYTPAEFDQAISGTKPKPEGVRMADLTPSVIHKGTS